MKLGDLVWHIEDIKEGCAIPGIVTAFYVDDTDDHPDEVGVLFTDRGYNEVHPIYELVVNLDATTR